MVFILGTWYLNLWVLRLHAGEVCCKRTRQCKNTLYARLSQRQKRWGGTACESAG